MAALSRSTNIVLAGPRNGIAINGLSTRDGEELASFLFQLIPQWPILRPQGSTEGEPLDEIIVQRQSGHWRISSPHMPLDDYPLEDGYTVANALIGALIAAYVAQADDLASIHAGAAAMGGGLVLFLGDNESGKSTFTAVLAARGQRFFADDRLILDLSKPVPMGTSLAIAPKLRLPLPTEADTGSRDFVAENSILSWPEMAVLQLGHDRAAAFGDSLPIRALVYLRRDDGAGAAKLTEMRAPDMVRVLLEQLFAPHLTQHGELSACVRLTQGAEIWQLRYGSAFQAADTVISKFSVNAPVVA